MVLVRLLITQLRNGYSVVVEFERCALLLLVGTGVGIAGRPTLP